MMVFILILKFFWPARKHTVFSCTPIISQSKVHLHLWWNQKASFWFSWASTETCCPLLGILLASLPPCFLTTLQMSSTFLSVRTHNLWGLSSPCSLMSKLAASWLNPSWMYVSRSYMAIISGSCSICTHWIPSSFLGTSYSGRKSHLKVTPFLHALHQDPPLSLPEWLAHSPVLTTHSLCPDHSLLCLCLLLHLAAPFTKGHWHLTQALLHLLAVTMALGILSPI